ncbi:Actin-binding cofilin/tropomyosin type [Lasiodiplodia theobromae]|uniref:Cofilin n=2 Tax=Lasiodiplodia TaxID=66739 RepID=A0A5N5DDE0_9PEZI|nr:Cofilin [Lasiodiplodia theobromae]KAB2575876.1 Cofilin [Lasiodiplodia theobromae]KAF4546494.1 Cofilin [Lasiodiplodia theobromae]KAF9631905.1 Actin-binding cofilin/tropomyosin type [Lasiodiplodia theobromae]KAK0662711.1 Cofilin [Lasiodiplodia hormozganensis]
MASSGVSVSPDCVSIFNDLKLGKELKWIVYQIADNGKEIVVEHSEKKTEESEEEQWNRFREFLLNSKTKNKAGKEGRGARYAVYDVMYDAAAGSYGEGLRNKITFLSWIPDDLAPWPKMVYSSSKDAIKRALTGVALDIQANDDADIEFATVIEKVSKGRF